MGRGERTGWEEAVRARKGHWKFLRCSDLGAVICNAHVHYHPPTHPHHLFPSLTRFQLTRSSVSNLACAMLGQTGSADGPEEASEPEGLTRGSSPLQGL